MIPITESSAHISATEILTKEMNHGLGFFSNCGCEGRDKRRVADLGGKLEIRFTAEYGGNCRTGETGQPEGFHSVPFAIAELALILATVTLIRYWW